MKPAAAWFIASSLPLMLARVQVSAGYDAPIAAKGPAHPAIAKLIADGVKTFSFTRDSRRPANTPTEIYYDTKCFRKIGISDVHKISRLYTLCPIKSKDSKIQRTIH